jgi:hypothetical protein
MGNIMQQPPNLNPQYPEQQNQEPLQHQPRKQPSKKKLWNLLWLLVVPVLVIAFILGLASRGQNQQPATTTLPTTTPTQNPTVPTRSQIDALLISNEPDVTVASYNQQSATLVLQESFSHIVSITQNETKQNLQDIQVKVWQQDWYFSQVTVNILQAQDNGQIKKIGYSVITGETASNINWTSRLDLWDKYDQKYLDPSLPNY